MPVPRSQIAGSLLPRCGINQKKAEPMREIALAAAVAAVFTSAPLFIGTMPAQADNIKMAQVDVQIGRDRDDRYDRDRDARRDRRDRDLTVGFGANGVTIGP